MKTSKMCDVYRCQKQEGMYVYLSAEDGLSVFPEALQRRTGALNRVMSLELTPDKQLANANAEDVLTAIDHQGFYLQMPPQGIRHV